MNLDLTDLTTLRSELLQKEKSPYEELAQHRSEIARDFVGTLGCSVGLGLGRTYPCFNTSNFRNYDRFRYRSLIFS